ncbi:MAG TPA: hypothetical protein PLN95_04145 [Candidatus Saccharibacteria bacterium]|nr:hypothetical protein [Candidatus Saccharibacteria bacterium]
MAETKPTVASLPKVFFIRVKEDDYNKIVELAREEDRSTNKMANLLLRSALESRNM